jgi:arylformamidase
MEIIDISLSISAELIIWPGDEKPRIEIARNIQKHGYNLSTLHIGAHSGTHIDAPSHFIEGALGADKIPLENLIGRAQVIDFSDKRDKISSADFEKIELNSNTRILLIKSRNSELYDKKDFTPDFVYLDESAAKWLIKKKIKTVGIDYLSIASFKSGAIVHKLLLENGISIIEGLILKNVKEGIYYLICLPLKIKNCDGAPARAVLIKDFESWQKQLQTLSL